MSLNTRRGVTGGKFARITGTPLRRLAVGAVPVLAGVAVFAAGGAAPTATAASAPSPSAASTVHPQGGCKAKMCGTIENKTAHRVLHCDHWRKRADDYNYYNNTGHKYCAKGSEHWVHPGDTTRKHVDVDALYVPRHKTIHAYLNCPLTIGRGWATDLTHQNGGWFKFATDCLVSLG